MTETAVEGTMTEAKCSPGLLERLQNARAPDYRLDQEIFALDRGWSYPLEGAALQELFELTREHGRTNYTASIDAAVALVPEGMRWLVRNHGGRPLYDGVTGKGATAFANVYDEHGGVLDNDAWTRSTPAIALCIAALKARAAKATEAAA